jgi:hypothetical protein
MSSPGKEMATYASNCSVTSTEVTLVILDLEVNSNSGIIFDGSPPRVTRLAYKIPSLSGQSIIGYYMQCLQIPGVEISNVNDTTNLHQVLTASQGLPRRLMLSSHAPEANNDGCRYTHDIPATAYLGVHFSGFPAVVESVDKKSPMAGKIHPGQSVYALVVPGQPDLKLQSGGFTGHRVEEHLRQHFHVPGKQLVIADKPKVVRDQTSNRAFDDCIVQ